MSENPFQTMKNNEKNDERQMPDGVMERLEKQAERTGENLASVKQFFFDYIKTHYDCDDWTEEDDDLLEDWAEQVTTKLRSGTTSTANTSTFVGTFVGVHASTGDRRAGLARWLVRQFEQDPDGLISGGRAGHYQAQDGKWVIQSGDSTIETDEVADNPPSMGIRAGSEWLCFVSKAGNPYPPHQTGRYAYFLGNEQEEFVENSNIEMWRVDLQGADVNRAIKIGVPCIINVRVPGENTNENYKDILDTNEGFVDTINYSDDFVDETVRPLLNPFRYWVSDMFTDMYCPLEELADNYNANVRTFDTADGKGRAGPIVFTKGQVTRMSTEGREWENDEGGMTYSMALSSSALEDIYAGGPGSEVFCNISSACHDLTHPFSFEQDDEMWQYAEKTTVMVYGRIGMRSRNGTLYPSINVMGVFTEPRRARKRQNGGDTNMGQFN